MSNMLKEQLLHTGKPLRAVAVNRVVNLMYIKYDAKMEYGNMAFSSTSAGFRVKFINMDMGGWMRCGITHSSIASSKYILYYPKNIRNLATTSNTKFSEYRNGGEKYDNKIRL